MKPHGELNMSQYWQHYISAAEKNAQLTSNKLPHVLSLLKSSGKKLGLVTSSPGNIAYEVLSIVKLIEFFDSCLIGYGHFRGSKQNGILKALNILMASPEESGYVGDSVRDNKASEMAGVYFFLASWNHNTINDELRETATLVINDVECFVSAKFGPLMIFLKRWFAYNKITQGDIHEYQEKAIA